ncbi:MAG TPA: phosphotransferase [Clostridia bacterium]|nr:phosphotransferase [Clostridia bacterium]
MKHILTITDKEITGSDKLSAAEPRIAVNAILFDADENIALCYMGKYDLHTLPGGGVEVGEDLHRATQREVWEETGCQCEIIGELGKIIENRYDHDFTQERSYYIARVTGEKGELHLTDEEIAENTSVVWLPIEQALRIISEKEHENYQRKFIQKRDISALTEAMLWMRLHDIPGYDSFVKIESITKGWSDDKKYFVETADGKRMLLRVSDISELDRKKAEYKMMERVYELGVLIPKPLGFGLRKGGRGCYSLSGWLDGGDVEKVLPLMSETEQYVLGLKAGETLREIHTLSAPVGIASWQERYSAVIYERIEAYRCEGIPFEGNDIILDYLGKNQNLLYDRPQCFLHGDYHEGNLMVGSGGDLYIIDLLDEGFGNYGDPWYDFKTFGENENAYFSTGFVRGYFNGEPPQAFWDVLTYYTVTVALTSIIWMKYHKLEELHETISWNERNAQALSEGCSPLMKWYLKDFYIQWIDGIPYKLKAPFDFSFISKYGKVFKIFDNQGSGNICFGMAEDENKYFVKFAGAPTGNYTGTAEDAIERLKRAVPTYQDLAHPNVINLIKAEEIGGGYAAVFDWVDATHMWTPDGGQEVKNLPVEKHYKIFENILDFHKHMAEKGYSALDFYEDHIMWDLKNERAVICDIDFTQKVGTRVCPEFGMRTANGILRSSLLMVQPLMRYHAFMLWG